MRLMIFHLIKIEIWKNKIQEITKIVLNIFNEGKKNLII